MKTRRIRAQIKRFLETGTKSTTEILEFINTNSRHGTTPQQLGNVLSKDTEIIKVGMVSRTGLRYKYDICEWALAPSQPTMAEVRHDHPLRLSG